MGNLPPAQKYEITIKKKPIATVNGKTTQFQNISTNKNKDIMTKCTLLILHRQFLCKDEKLAKLLDIIR